MKAPLLCIFRFISTSYDAHLQTRWHQSSAHLCTRFLSRGNYREFSRYLASNGTIYAQRQFEKLSRDIRYCRWSLDMRGSRRTLGQKKWMVHLCMPRDIFKTFPHYTKPVISPPLPGSSHHSLLNLFEIWMKWIWNGCSAK